MTATIEAAKPMALRSRDAAKALGVSDRTLWQYTKDGVIPCKRLGTGKKQTVLYPVAALEAWLSEGAVATEAAPF